ncbi:MAG: phosphotransferase [Anaerolineae bacterium]|nr:phosphotransferase [Anaerolineae bacterium]
MDKHHYFNLYIHDDQELAVYIGGEIAARETLHEWPLSCVARVTTRQGQWIYKSQFGPTVEAEFYAAVRSDLLGQVQTIYRADGHACTLRDYVDAPLIEDLKLDEAQAAEIVRQVRARMSEIEGDLPYLYDIHTPDRWLALVTGTLQDITALIAQGQYTVTTPEMVSGLQHWAQSSSTVEAVQRQPGLVHGDFHGDNLFILPGGGYRVIDWQRPFWGPTELDVAAMMDSLGFDPLNHVSPGIVQIGHFMLIHWFSQCATRWFPEAAESYDRSTVELALKIQSLS